MSEAKSRACKSSEEKDFLRDQNRKRMAAKRATKSTEHKQKENEQSRKRMSARRATKSTEEKQNENDQNRKRMCAERATQRTSVQYKEALRSKYILEGIYKVSDLKESPDSIGAMDFLCQYCIAMKFKKETSSTCCGNGKVLLDPFPKAPPQLDELWHADTAEG